MTKFNTLSQLNDAVLKFQSMVDNTKTELATQQHTKLTVIHEMDKLKLQAEKKVLFEDHEKVFKNDTARKSGVQQLLNENSQYNDLSDSLDNLSLGIIDTEKTLMENRRIRNHKKSEQKTLQLEIMVENNVNSLS